MKKQIWIPILIVVIIAAGLLLYTSQKSKQAEEKEVIKIGVILPLTGKAAQYGKESQQGIELAKEELNLNRELKQFKIEVFYEDSKFDTKEGVSAYQKLRNFNNIPIVITGASQVSLAISPLANQEKILQMAIFSSTPKYTSPRDFTFRVATRSEVEDGELAKFVVPKYKNIALLYINNEWGMGHLEAILPIIKKLKGNVLIEEKFLLEDTDFRTQLTKIKAKNPEAVFLLAEAKNAGLILKQAKEMGLKVVWFGIRSLQSEELFTIAGDAADGLIYTYPFDPESENPVVKNFVEKYRAKYNEAPTSYSAEGHDALKVIISAVIQCQKVDIECIKEKLLNTKDYQGALGKITFDENGDVYYPYSMKTIKNGQFVPLEN